MDIEDNASANHPQTMLLDNPEELHSYKQPPIDCAAEVPVLSHDPIDPNKILKVYSGRPGCMCGCRGKYTYSATHPEAAALYPQNDAVLKQTLRKMAKIGYLIDSDVNCLYTPERNVTRFYVAYYAEGEHHPNPQTQADGDRGV